MCAAALLQLNVRRVYCGCKNERFGGCGSVMSINLPVSEYRGYECISGIYEKEAIELLKVFYEYGNPNAPIPRREVK